MNLERRASFRTDIHEFGLRIILRFSFMLRKQKINQYLESNILYYGHRFGPIIYLSPRCLTKSLHLLTSEAAWILPEASV